MGVGALRRHHARLHDAESVPGVVEGPFVHPNEDPEAVKIKLDKEAEEAAAEAAAKAAEESVEE